MSGSTTKDVLVPIREGSPVLVAGPTNSGKTRWVRDLLSSPASFSRPVASVLYCYGVHQKAYEEPLPLPVEYREGLPSRDDLRDLASDGKFHVLVLDDLMESVVRTSEMADLFSKYCHHLSISAIFVSQNVFARGPHARTISLNCHVIVLFSNKRDASQVRVLARQFFPTRWRRLVEAYEDATSRPYGYLLVDCTPAHPKEVQVRTVLEDGTVVVYDV